MIKDKVFFITEFLILLIFLMIIADSIHLVSNQIQHQNKKDRISSKKRVTSFQLLFKLTSFLNKNIQWKVKILFFNCLYYKNLFYSLNAKKTAVEGSHIQSWYLGWFFGISSFFCILIVSIQWSKFMKMLLILKDYFIFLRICANDYFPLCFYLNVYSLNYHLIMRLMSNIVKFGYFN